MNHAAIRKGVHIAFALLILISLSGCQIRLTTQASTDLPSSTELIQTTKTSQAETAVLHSPMPLATTKPSARTRVCFTFDDGPDPITTPKILDVLKQYNVKAAFFVIGSRAEANPEIISRMVAEGHLVCNHTYSHPINPDMTKLTDEQIRQEIDHCDAVLEKITHIKPLYFRAPGGAVNDHIRAMSGHPIINWTIEGGDWYITDVDVIYTNIYSKLSDKAIIMIHDNHEVTVEAVKKLLANLPKDQYEMLNLDELLSQ